MAERVTQRHAEAVAEALTYIPPRLRPLVGCDVFCGDPIFAGLHDTVDIADGRSYRDQAHVCYPHHVADRRVTLVLPERRGDVAVVLHEFGHVLHWHLQDRAGGWHEVPTLEPVTRYATTNDEEAFAEAFVAWFYPPRQIEACRQWWLRWSRANDEFFDRLVAV